VSVEEHHRHGHKSLKVGVLTASDSRSAETDESGRLIRDLLTAAGHRGILHAMTGGGQEVADKTAALDKELEGFGELFRYLSYQQIGSAAFLSRALAGVAAGKIVVTLPGSPDACRLAMEKLLIPELGHMAHLLKL